MRLKLIACEILYREFCLAVARSVNQVDVEFLPKGLHDIGQAGMNAEISKSLEAVDPVDYDAVVLGYGLCSNGLVGLAARDIPLILPRAHDCMTLFLGSKERYLDYFENHPGTYFKTTGWVERGDQLEQLQDRSVQQQTGMNQTYEELVEKYGEDNAKFLYDQLCDMTRNYGRIAFIEMGVEPDDRFEQTARKQANENGWEFEHVTGDMRLVHQLLDGPWDEEHFLTIPPGHQIATSFDRLIVKAEPVE